MILSIGMIVKNEEKNLRACLNGIKPILEQVDSELIIADTGSSDGTEGIAREFTSMVYRIEWEGDFAKARNTTLERASGKWYMFLDADEVFQDVSDIIEFFNSGEYRKYGAARHLRREAGLGRDSVVTRLFKRDRDTAFIGRIHENIPAKEPVKTLESLSLHTGYVYNEDGAKREAKRERNLRPLMEAYKENPGDIRTITQIAAEHMTHGDYEEAGRFIEEGLKARDGGLYRHVLARLNALRLYQSGRREQALEEIEKYFKSTPKPCSLAVDLRLVQARALAETGRREEAVEAYLGAISLLKDYEAGKLDNRDIECGLTTAPAPETEAAAALGIAAQYSGMGEAEKALEWIRKYKEFSPPRAGKTDLLSRTETIFVLWDATVLGNGLVYSVFRKVKLMEDNWGYRPLILSCKHSPGFREAVEWLKRDGRGENQIGLNKESRILNVYDYFQRSYAPGLPRKERPANGVREEYGDNINGEDGAKTRTFLYDDWGYLNRISYHSSKVTGYIPLEDYYTTGGSVCVRACYDFAGGENVLNKLIVYDERGGVIRECAEEAELAALCLERLTRDASKRYLIVMENDEVSKPFNLKDKPNVAIMAELHNVFLEDPYDLASKPWFPYRNLCANRNAFDGIVMLTEASKDDFTAKYGPSPNLFVIPHPYPYPVVRTDFDKRDRKLAVMVARFDTQKRVDVCIDIFSRAVKVMPDVRLEIYGFGSLRDEYEAMISRLGLSGNVFLMGPATKPAEVFAGAALSVMTSDYEGFPLTLAESICNGCPVMAYDIKYGPSGAVKDGETGFLIPRFDKVAFASKLVEYFSDAGKQREMSENCYRDAGRFSAETFLERWYNMMYNILTNTISNTFNHTRDNVFGKGGREG